MIASLHDTQASRSPMHGWSMPPCRIAASPSQITASPLRSTTRRLLLICTLGQCCRCSPRRRRTRHLRRRSYGRCSHHRHCCSRNSACNPHRSRPLHAPIPPPHGTVPSVAPPSPPSCSAARSSTTHWSSACRCAWRTTATKALEAAQRHGALGPSIYRPMAAPTQVTFALP